jgi:uncharacterized UPF0160 family protein
MNYYTHAGRFHADEITGYAITAIAGVCDKFVRLTNINDLPEDGIISDIGGVHNPLENRFDHHQGYLTRPNGYPYASAGLLWAEFGWQAVISVLREHRYRRNYAPEIVDEVDKFFIQPIDANDSDNQYNVTAQCSAGSVEVMTLPAIVAMFNSEDVNDHESQNARFNMMVLLIKSILEKQIISAMRRILDEVRIDEIIHVDGCVAVLSENLRWRKKIREDYPEINFVILPSSHPGSAYSMIAVEKEEGKREVRIPIERPKFFTEFIHQGKWIAGSNSIEELIELGNWNAERYGKR